MLGAEEFAFRKGWRYGTALVDIEAARVVDVGAALVSPTGVPHHQKHRTFLSPVERQCGAPGEPEGYSVTPGHNETV
ncbi:hypothetical protein ACJWDR_43810 [Streptomyces tauricus]|uniref:hypothetical protein n=1 Tax=Streptomyces tauricus TaxID=68274 RepID=UPI00387F35A8